MRRPRELLSWAERQLRGHGIDGPRRDAELLLAHCAGRSRVELYAYPEMEIPDRARRSFLRAVRRRAAREPLQYITGSSAFRHLELAVDGRVLIPRPETEMLVERALEIMRMLEGEPLVVDVGTGSGCVALSLAAEYPGAALVATDVSGGSLQVARENALRLGMEGRIEFRRGVLLEALPPTLRGRVDLVVSNPPYVREGDFEGLPPEVRDHEPREALVAGPRGTEVHARLLAESPAWLKPGGWLLMECGADQGEELRDMAERCGYAAVSVRADLAGRPRVLEARVKELP